MNATKEIATKLLKTVDAGMCSGLGEPIPGQMCIIATKRFAFGLCHSDSIEDVPVGPALRSLDIAINDSNWSSNEARAKGMRRLAIAEMGSDKIDQKQFRLILALRVSQKLLPSHLREYTRFCKPEYVENLISLAEQFSETKTIEDVKSSLDSLANLNNLNSLDSLANLNNLNSLDSLDSLASLDSLYSLDSLASLDSLYSLARLASLYSLASLDRLARLARLASLNSLYRDKFLTSIANIAVEVLIEMKCQGCEWLDLCD